MQLITKNFEETPIIFNQKGWINATQTAKAFGKDIRAFMRSKQYKEYEKALSKYLKTDAQNLHTAQSGGNLTKNEQGTFLHPDLLIAFARWLSPDFAVWCDMVIVKGYLQGIIESQQKALDQLVEHRDWGKWWMND